MTRTRIAEALAVLSTATALFAFAPSEALGQVDETFSAGSNRVSPFQDVAERFPECAGLVAQFDALTAQLYALSDERRIAHHPRTDAIDAEMRSIENERSPVTQQINDFSSSREFGPLSTFPAQVPTAKSWYHGNDDDATVKAFQDMIRQMLAGEADPKKIIELGATKVNQTIK